MSYIYRKRNKFPHIVCIYSDPIPLSVFYLDINPWCKENIGVYNDTWFCPGHNNQLSARYAFKNKIDAMAFRLRWE